MSKSNMVTIKFLCSYSGRIVPRYPDGKLRYLGGETRVLSVDRSIAFSELLLKLGELCGTPLCILRCQLPTEDLDALVSITSDEDLANLIEEYDQASPPPSSLKIRAFLSPPKSAKKISPTPSSASSSSSTTSTSPKANSGSTPRLLKTSAADRCPAPQISTPAAAFPLCLDKSAAGKLHSHHQYQYQYHHQHHGDEFEHGDHQEFEGPHCDHWLTLKLQYLDLYLIHWPISAKPSEKLVFPIDEEDLLPMDYKGVWQAMEECQTQGLTKSIGVSNFSCKKLGHILSFATIIPLVNQVEMSPLWQQRKLRDFCKANGVNITAYAPLGA